MSEIPETKELAELSKNPDERKVGLVISVIAILLAVCAGFGNRADNNEIVARVNASNTWAYFQAKRIRSFQSDTSRDLLDVLSAHESPGVSSKAREMAKKYAENRSRYEEEAKQITDKAKAYESEADLFERKGDRFDLGEIFLQVSVVLCSVTILTRFSLFLYGGIIFAGIGTLLGLSAFLL